MSTCSLLWNYVLRFHLSINNKTCRIFSVRGKETDIKQVEKHRGQGDVTGKCQENRHSNPIPYPQKESSEPCQLNLQADQNIGGVHGEIRFSNNSAPNVHEGVQQPAERWRILLEGNYECRALKVLIGEIQERDDAGDQ